MSAGSGSGSGANAHPEIEIYNRMVFQATLETAILAYLSTPPEYIQPVYDGIRAWALRARDAIVTKARGLAEIWDGKVESVDFYGMTVKYRFGALADKLEQIT